ncbi:MAG: choice-of-anchor Q domain-containing protein [bacterium]
MQSISPCIDAGLNTARGISGTSADKDGNPRITNGIVDMGAYEYQGAPPPPCLLAQYMGTYTIQGSYFSPEFVGEIEGRHEGLTEMENGKWEMGTTEGNHGGVAPTVLDVHC